MKKILSVLLLTVMILCACASAFAEVQYDATNAFLAVLDANDLEYEVNGVNEIGEEHIIMKNEDENFAYDINIYFHEDNDRASVYVWDIIAYSDADLADVLYVVNDLNASYKYVRFYVDDSDNTVTCAMNMILHDNNEKGDIVLEGLLRMASILQVAYPKLAPYNVK